MASETTPRPGLLRHNYAAVVTDDLGRRPPRPLLIAAALCAVEAVGLLVAAVAEGVAFDPDRAVMGATTTAFFAAYAVALLGCAWAVTRGRSWGRSPLVLAQLIQLGVAWSFRGGSTTWLAAVLAVVALVVGVGLVHRSTTAFLLPGEPEGY